MNSSYKLKHSSSHPNLSQQLTSFPKTGLQQLIQSTGGNKYIRSLVESSDSKHRICLYESDIKQYYFILKIWDIQDKNNPKKLGSVSFYGSQFHNICFSDDYQFCVINFDKHYIIDMQNKNSPIILSPSFGSESTIGCLLLDNKYFVSTSHDGGLCVYDLHNKTDPQLVKEIPPHFGCKIQNMMIMPDEKYLVTFSRNTATQKTLLELWNIENIHSIKLSGDMAIDSKIPLNSYKHITLTSNWNFKLTDGTLIDFPKARESLAITTLFPNIIQSYSIPRELSNIILELTYPFFKAKKTPPEDKPSNNITRNLR